MIATLECADDSRLWGQLENGHSSDKTSHRELIANVARVVKNAEWITDRIIEHLPQYTLHNRRHLLNVLSIMDALVTEDTLHKLTPLECALCILASFTHDLGMALPADEYIDLTSPNCSSVSRRQYERHREAYSIELREIKRLKDAPNERARRRVSVLEGHILAEYVRRTHADLAGTRVRTWLKELMIETGNERLFTYGAFDFTDALTQLAVSHNQPPDWLLNRLSLPSNDTAFYAIVGTGERANLTFPGLLLRLADIMDFDASRTPSILFRHFGIDNEQSIREWEKHLSVIGWDLDINNPPTRLTYAAVCDHPAHEKAIRTYVTWIQEEVHAVRNELARQNRRLGADGLKYDLHLPDLVTTTIVPRQEEGQPVYVYHDLGFRLSQQEIMSILMGESLYGDPGICIRECLQNALDAVELRDKRLQLLEKDPEAHVAPTDRLKKGEHFQVKLTWGVDDCTGSEFIRVTDNGVGMGEEVLHEYFANVGKSYYRSVDFERERTLMADSGIPISPISQFGIGILSCFMIGDSFQIRTCPGGRRSQYDCSPWDVYVSGPDNLFWLRPGTRDVQGTEITVFLKPGVRLKHEPEKLAQRAAHHFGYYNKDFARSTDSPSNELDPEWLAIQHIVWPLYPIYIEAPGHPQRCLDSWFHVDELDHIDTDEAYDKARLWKCPKAALGTISWGVWDWADRITDSRIRLMFPRHADVTLGARGKELPADPPKGSPLCAHDELATFVEPQMGRRKQYFNLVKGIYVERSIIGSAELLVSHGIGTKLWLDLRGDLAPRLTADRSRARSQQDPRWLEAIRQMVHRFSKELWAAVDEVETREIRSTIRKNLLFGLSWHASARPSEWSTTPIRELDLCEISFPSWAQERQDVQLFLWRRQQLLMEASYYTSWMGSSYDYFIEPVSKLARDTVMRLRTYQDVATADVLGAAREMPENFSDRIDLDLSKDLVRYDLYRGEELMSPILDVPHRLDEGFQSLKSLPEEWRLGAQSHYLMEGFFPDLCSSFPCMGVFEQRGWIGDGV